jgi:hypothetical protein
MAQTRHKLTIIILMMWVCVVMFGASKPNVYAQSDNIDIVVVIDNSGSMHSKNGSDPSGLRYEATKMLINLVTENDRIGIVHFSDNARVVGDTMYRVSGIDKETLSKELDMLYTDYVTGNDLRERTKDGWVKNDAQVKPSGTKYGIAFDTTREFLQKNKQNNKQAVIFLTDGAPDDWNAESINATVQEQIKQMNVPVYLLALNNNKDKSNDMEATKQAFTQANQQVVTIDSANDIAQALARVITELQPGTYVDVLQGVDDSVIGTAVYKTSAIPDQQIKQVTFVFASNTNKEDLTIDSKLTPDGLVEQRGKSKHFQTFAYEVVNGKINGKWEYSANALPNAITNFVFMRTDLRMQLRYPSATTQISAYPRNANKVLIGATIDGITKDSFDSVKLVSGAASCALGDLTGAQVKINATRSAGISNSDDPLFWSTVQGKDVPIFVAVVFQPTNALVLRRCFELQPTDTEIPFKITQPAIAKPDPNAKGNIEVVADKPVADGLNIFRSDLFDQPPPNETGVDNTLLVPMIITDDRMNAEVETTAGGAHVYRLVTSGTYKDRPIVFYAQQDVTPTMNCVYRLTLPNGQVDNQKSNSPLDTVSLGIITSTQTINKTIVCTTKISLDQIPQFDLAKAQLTNTDTGYQQALPQNMLDVQAAKTDSSDGLSRWPMSLRNVSRLEPGNYSIQIPTNKAGEAGKFITITFNRPKSQIQLTLPDFSVITESGLNFDDQVDAINTTLSRCLSRQAIMTPDTTIKPELAVSQLSNGDSGSQAASLIDAQLIPDNTCTGGLKLIITVNPSLAPGLYDMQLVGQTQNGVPVAPNPLRATFTKKGPEVTIYFPESQRVLDARNTNTYVLTHPVWPISLPFIGNTDIVYTATVKYDNLMPDISNPKVENVADVEMPANQIIDAGYFFKWANTHAIDTAEYGGILMTDEFPRLRWPGSTYDVQLAIDDARVVSPKRVVMRIETYSWWHVIGLLLGLLVLGVVLRWLWINLTKAYSGTVRFMFDDLSSKKLDLTIFKNEKVAIIRPSNGGIETLRAIPNSKVQVEDEVMAYVNAVNREKINVNVISDQLNPEGIPAREILLGNTRSFGELLRVSYRRRN